MLRIVTFCVLSLTVTTMAHAQSPNQVIDQIRWLLDDIEARVLAIEGECIIEGSASTPEADPAIPPLFLRLRGLSPIPNTINSNN